MTVISRVTLGFVLAGSVLAACGDVSQEQGDTTADAPAADALPAAAEAGDPSPRLPPEQIAFWEALEAHCGQAYSGSVSDVTDYYREGIEGTELVAHFLECEPERMHVALHIDENRSRNWILTQVDGTIRLKHDHQNVDGVEEEISQYGGDAPVPGLPTRQIFPADEHTAAILPDRADNFWFMELIDEETFQYGVHWPRLGHSIRLEFDLSTPIDPPPRPWGY